MSDVPDDIFALIEADETGLPIQIAVDPDGVAVFLSRTVWMEHILNRHADTGAVKVFIPTAISDPNVRYFEDNMLRVAFSELQLPADYQDSQTTLAILRVVIKYVYPAERNFERTGLVSTAYLNSQKREP